MSQYVETPTRTFPVSGALGQYLRVKTPTSVALAGATDVSIGTMEKPTFSGDSHGTVRLANAQGTRKMVAAGAITAGNPVYAAANGKIASSGTVVEGRALEAATTDGDIIEVMSLANTDISSSIATTNAATFEVDADASTPKIALSGQSGGTGDYTTTLKPESTLSGDNAIIVPEADGDTLVAVALAQTLTNKTITGGLFNLAVAAVTATGSAQGDAAALTAGGMNVVSAGDDTKGVVLPTAAASGSIIAVLNSGSAGLKIYPASSDKINNGSADAAITILENTLAIFIPTAADNWAAIYTANS